MGNARRQRPAAEPSPAPTSPIAPRTIGPRSPRRRSPTWAPSTSAHPAGPPSQSSRVALASAALSTPSSCAPVPDRVTAARSVVEAAVRACRPQVGPVGRLAAAVRAGVLVREAGARRLAVRAASGRAARAAVRRAGVERRRSQKSGSDRRRSRRRRTGPRRGSSVSESVRAGCRRQNWRHATAASRPSLLGAASSEGQSRAEREALAPSMRTARMRPVQLSMTQSQ